MRPVNEPDFYVIEVTGTIQATIGGCEAHIATGAIKLLRVLAVAAYDAGLPLIDVCDAHSDYLVAVYEAIFDKDGEPKPELEIEPS